MPDPRGQRFGGGRVRPLRTVPHADARLEFHTIHGYRRAFRVAGTGPALLLIHGIGDSSATWIDLIPHLAQRYTVIAPDLLGHGRSDKPRADYSVAAYANGMRDLLDVLGVERATVIGHSLGGAVAMQFAYQFPERVDRLVLVSTSAITKDIHPLLRVTTMPLANQALRLLGLPGGNFAAGVLRGAAERLRGAPFLPAAITVDTPDLAHILGDIGDRTSYLAFLKTLQAVVDWRGQVITLLDRCYLGRQIPVQIVWGAKDSIFPVAHAQLAHQAMPGSRVEVFPRSGHYPFHEDPMRFLTVLEDFLTATAPAAFDRTEWRETLETGGAHAVSSPRRAVLDAVDHAERSAT